MERTKPRPRPLAHIIDENIRRLLNDKGQGFDWLSEEARVGVHYLKEMREGGGDLPLGLLDRVAMALGVSTHELCEDHEKEVK